MEKKALSITRTRRFWSGSIVIIILVLSTFFLLLTSCGGTNIGDSITLEFVPGDVSPSNYEVTGFDVEGNFVLRCASSANNDHGLVIETSKSKNMKANALVFVKQKHIEGGRPQTDVQIAIAPIIGKEYEYDMTQARFYTVTILSAKKAIEAYGIPYLDWQSGACNSSEQFPCCE